MSIIGPTLESYFAGRLVSQRQASARTISAYRDMWRLLLHFACQRSGKAASKLDFGDLDAPAIASFLSHLEDERGNTVRTRNTRLAAIHSFFRYSALVHPEHAGLIQRVLAIPAKRCDRADISFLSPAEIDALLAIPDRTSWIGRRDHSLLLLAMQTGLRVSELTGLTRSAVELGTAPPYVRSYGKGRKNRVTPLTAQAVAVLRVWLRERGGGMDEPLFPSRRGGRLSRDAVEFLLAKYVKAAGERCPSLRKKRVTAHVLRHTAAMLLLQAGVDTTVIALWLGHESLKSTQIYLHADLAIKQHALDRTAPIHTAPGRYRAPDSLLAFLDRLNYAEQRIVPSP
jgi:integrase/recombinase XerD